MDEERLRILMKLESQAERIFREELRNEGIKYDVARLKIYPHVRTVGVQGDARAYDHPVEIELRYNGEILWDSEFLARLSTRITNEVERIELANEKIGVNRVLYVILGK